MGALLNKLVTEHYLAHSEAGDSSDDALSAMKAIERDVVEEVLQENADAALQREIFVRETYKQKEQEQNLRDSIRSFNRLLLEGVVLATVIGLIGSHLYGLGEAWWYDTNQSFNNYASLAMLVLLVLACIGLVFYMFVNSLPEWVAHALRRNDDE